MSTTFDTKLLVEAITDFKHEICGLAHELKKYREHREREFDILRLGLASKHDLLEMERRIMATQAEMAAKVLADLKLTQAQLTKLAADVAGFQPSVDALKAKIVELQAIIDAAGVGGAITQEMVDTAAENVRLVGVVDDGVPELPPV